MSSNLRKFLHEYQNIGPLDWGMRIARGAVSGIPIVGGVLAEVMGPAVDAAKTNDDPERENQQREVARELKDIVLATGALGQDLTLANSYNISSIVDHGIGSYPINLTDDAAGEYLVSAQAPGAIVDVPTQSASSFTLSVLDRKDPTCLIDAPVKFVVLKT